MILKKYRQRQYCLLALLILLACAACEKFVEINPPKNSLTDKSIYSQDATAINALNTLLLDLNAMSSGTIGSGDRGLSLLCGLAADELSLYSGVTSFYRAYYTNQLSVSSSVGSEHWSHLYQLIFICNQALENLTASTTLTPAVKNELIGEAYFMRSFYYFYLVNLYGPVPLSLTTDYTKNSSLARVSAQEVYSQVINDAKQAEALLSNEYLDGTLLLASDERVRPNKWAAKALLARAYLYEEKYALAASQSSEIIANNSLFTLPALNETFLKNSREAIWQITPMEGTLYNSADAYVFIIPPTGPSDGVNTAPSSISPFLLNSFESGDQRATNWIGSQTVAGDTYYYPFKYKLTTEQPVNEYLMVFRLGEQYLILAEAAARNGDMHTAISALDTIRNRAGLPKIEDTDPSISQQMLIDTIMHERRVELFTEWGHRWFDLKRTGVIDSVMATITPLKANGAPWQSYQQWFPVLREDLIRDKNLTQNVGY